MLFCISTSEVVCFVSRYHNFCVLFCQRMSVCVPAREYLSKLFKTNTKTTTKTHLSFTERTNTFRPNYFRLMLIKTVTKLPENDLVTFQND